MTASPTDDLASAERRIQELTKELSEAQEQQVATADILRVISSSPTDLHRVFAEIAASAARLCDAHDATINLVDGDFLRLVAHHGPIPVIAPVGQTVPLIRGVAPGRAVLDRRTVHVADMQVETDEYPMGSDRARRLGFRTTLVVPLIRAGDAIGAIAIRRTEVRLFSDKQIALLQTFADQAVIAIENTRLFEAEQARTRELGESLERQTATSDVLSVISRSPTDLQSVFDAIAAKALDLCGAMTSAVLTFDGQLIYLAAARRFSAELAVVQENWPSPPSRAGATGRAILSKASAYVPDVFEDSEYPLRTIASAIGYRSILSVPMLRDDRPLGAITITAAQPRAFSPKLIALLQTFADQAVIAIENTRLFEEVQARTKELHESLDRQTATSE